MLWKYSVYIHTYTHTRLHFKVRFSVTLLALCNISLTKANRRHVGFVRAQRWLTNPNGPEK